MAWLIVLIVVVAVIVLALAALMAAKRNRIAKTRKREQAREHLQEAQVRAARADQQQALAEEQAARARREQAEAEERAARAQQEAAEYSWYQPPVRSFSSPSIMTATSPIVTGEPLR